MARSRGVYRIPYRNGTPVRVAQDHTTHSNGRQRIDLVAKGDDLFDLVVAAADGVVLKIVDGFSENRPGESPCNNNYVWLEHPTGEWTKYSHMAKDSVTGEAGLREGDAVRAGRFLGIESDVGCAHGQHLHFEVADLTSPDDIDDEGFIRDPDLNRVPFVCGIPGNEYRKGDVLRATGCQFVPTSLSFPPVVVGDVRTRTLTIANMTGDDVHVRIDASVRPNSFLWPAFDAQVPNGTFANLTVVFQPPATGVVSQKLTVTGPPGGPRTVDLRGTGRPGEIP